MAQSKKNPFAGAQGSHMAANQWLYRYIKARKIEVPRRNKHPEGFRRNVVTEWTRLKVLRRMVDKAFNDKVLVDK
jgi:hypothetical protein